jgi:acyl-CoA synthetase
VLVLGGEAFPSTHPKVKALVKNGTQVFNIYGITEMSCWATLQLVDENILKYLKLIFNN